MDYLPLGISVLALIVSIFAAVTTYTQQVKQSKFMDETAQLQANTALGEFYRDEIEIRHSLIKQSLGLSEPELRKQIEQLSDKRTRCVEKLKTFLNSPLSR